MDKNNKICLDVSGHLFKINKDIFTNGPESGLSRLVASGDVSELNVLEIDRPAEAFCAILAWYQTGELHIPASSCPRAFLNELQFWEISPEVLSSCCNNRLQAFLSEQDTLLDFGRSTSSDCVYMCRQFEYIRSKIWSIVEFTRPSMPGKIYFLTTLFMILLSIFTLACSTDKRFQRDITNCERLEYMKSANMKDYALVKKTLERYCDVSEIPGITNDLNTPKAMLKDADDQGKPQDMLKDSRTEITKREVKEGDFINIAFPIEHNMTSPPTTGVTSPPTNGVNSTATSPLPEGLRQGFMSEDLSSQPFLPPLTHKYVKLPNMKVPMFILLVLEAITIGYFTIDILLRLFSCPHIGRYFWSIINITDAAAILFTYVHYTWSYIHKHEQYTDNMIDLLKVFQMLRSLRLFRIVSNVKAGRVLAYSLRANLNDLFVLFLFLLCGVCLFSSCLYIVDKGESVSSIPEGWYWAVVTMTTVGFGDIVPKTPLGRVVTCFCMVFGVLLFAVTVPIFANNFLTLYQYADAENYNKKSIGRKNVSSSAVVHIDTGDSAPSVVKV